MKKGPNCLGYLSYTVSPILFNCGLGSRAVDFSLLGVITGSLWLQSHLNSCEKYISYLSAFKWNVYINFYVNMESSQEMDHINRDESSQE